MTGSNISPLPSRSTIVAACLQTGLVIPELLAEVDRFPAESWIAHVNSRDYEGEWSVLPLRCLYTHLQAHPLLQGFAHDSEDGWVDLPLLYDAPHLRRVLQGIYCPLKSVRLMRLASGARIKPHQDRGLAWEYGEARLHLPLRTDPQVAFLVGGEVVSMRQGELWYMNADLEHSVTNDSRENRIHLVVDCEVNDWLENSIVGSLLR